MDEPEYMYHVVLEQPSQKDIDDKKIEGWELCAVPEGEIGRELTKEPTVPHSKFYFRKKKSQLI